MEKTKIELQIMLKNSLLRCEIAYSQYIDDKKYYQALRIKSANEALHRLLEKYLLFSKNEDREDVINFLFHIEDWMHQFNDLEKKEMGLEEVFVFNRLDGSPSFPSEFAEKFINFQI